MILDEANEGPNPALGSTMRRDIWDTRAKAETSLRKAFPKWDPRAFERYLHFGLRPVPTLLYDPKVDQKIPQSSVTLTTSKHQEAWGYAQLNFEPRNGGLDRLLFPDWDAEIELPQISCRPECLIIMRNLPNVRPSVLYVFGAKSPLSSNKSQNTKVKMTGTGTGGNGGVAENMVERIVFQKSGHLSVFEKPYETADATAGWIRRWLDRWREDEKILIEYGSKKSDDNMLRMSKAWVDAVELPANALRPKL